MYWSKITPCAIKEHCYYQDYYGRNKDKCCRILIAEKDGSAPYKENCPFFKKDSKDFSGGRRDVRDEEVSEPVSGEDEE